MTAVHQWNKYERWLKEKLPAFHDRLNPPATEQRIQELENKIGIKFPADFRAIYQVNNGEALEKPADKEWFVGGALLGHKMLSIEIIGEEWKKCQQLDQTTELLWDVFPKEAIRKVYYHKHWVPIFTDTNGNYIGYDFAPAQTGKPGQMINWGADESDLFVIAGNLTDFITLINNQIDTGEVEKEIFEDDDEGTKKIFGFNGKGHLTDDLKRMILKK